MKYLGKRKFSTIANLSYGEKKIFFSKRFTTFLSFYANISLRVFDATLFDCTLFLCAVKGMIFEIPRMLFY